MEKWMKKLSGALIASALALTLSTKASAEFAEEEETLPPEDPSIEEEGAPGGEGEGILLLSADGPEDGAGGDAEGTDGGEGTMTAFDVGSGIPVGDVPEADPAGGSDGAGGTVGGDGAGSGTVGSDPTTGDGNGSATDQNSSGYISMDGVVIYPDSQSGNIDPVVDEATGGFWSYNEGNTEGTGDDSLVLVDWSASEIDAYDTDLYIVSSGVNQIGIIDASAGGDVYVAGTGIMLVEDILLGEGNGFYLQPIEGLYESGSVAVFVNITAGILTSSDEYSALIPDQVPYEGDTYILVNGSVPGILDEDYVLPDGIHLIMPDGSIIQMVSPGTPVLAEGADLGDTCGQIIIPSSTLTIPYNSSITVEEGASIVMAGKDLTDPLAAGKGTITYAPVMNVWGSLNGEGQISGKGLVAFHIGKDDPKPSAPAIGSGCFELIIRDGSIYFDDLDKELYEYLQANLSAADFAEVTSNGGIPDYVPPTHWGIHMPIFAFNIGGETPLFTMADAPANGNGDVAWFKFGIDRLGMGGGGSILDTSSISTGSGILGGSGAGDYKGDKGNSSLIFGTGKTPGPTSGNHSLVLEVTDRDTCYNLAAYYDGKQIFSLNGKVTVRFAYPAPAAEGRFFVVFRNGDGSLTAFAARYDAVTGQLVFSGDKLGDFVVVSIDDFDGQLFSAEFYAYLETISSVKALKASF